MRWLCMKPDKDDGNESPCDEDTTNCCDFQEHYTGIHRDMQWSGKFGIAAGLPLSSETELLKSGVLVRRGEFGELQGDRLEEVNEVAQQLGMTCSQAQSIRHQYMVKSFGFSSNERLDRQLDRIHFSFEKRIPILKLSYQLEQPPVNIFRALVKDRLRHKYALPKSSKVPRDMLRSIIQGQHPTDVLDDWEKRQLVLAKQNDIVTYEMPIAQAVALEWESAVQHHLEHEGVNFLSEDTIRLAGCNKTPDFLLLDNVSIHGRPVRWIEVKTFFASGTRTCDLFQKKVRRQVQKYETAFDGPGAVVFRHGFSDRLPPLISNTLCLDAGPLADDTSNVQQQNC